jgi:hypothetical protein
MYIMQVYLQFMQYNILYSYSARDAFTSTQNGDRCETITIRVRPVNEFDPEFNPPDQTVTIPEGSPPQGKHV